MPVVLVEPTAAAATAALKLAAAKAKKDGRSNNMKWQPFMSTFMLNKMCELISSGVRTDKGFKVMHLNTVAKQASSVGRRCLPPRCYADFGTVLLIRRRFHRR